jgi:hypothetical protein
MNQALMVIAFLFFQWFLINWAFSINNLNTKKIKIKEKDEEKAKVEKAEREYSFVEKQLNLDDKHLTVDADIEAQKKEIKIPNVESYNLSRGQIIFLPDGEKRTIVGFMEQFLESYNNSSIKNTVIIVDKPFSKDYDKFFINKENTESVTNKQLFSDHNKSIEDMGKQEREFLRKKKETELNIELLKSEIEKIKKKKPEEKEPFQTMDEYKESLSIYQKDLKREEEKLEFINTYLENLNKMRNNVIKSTNSIKNSVKSEPNKLIYQTISENTKKSKNSLNVSNVAE